MVEGSYKQGAYDSTQMGYWRPNDGGLLTFGAEVCVSDKVAEDCGIEKLWPVPKSVTAARAKGMPL